MSHAWIRLQMETGLYRVYQESSMGQYVYRTWNKPIQLKRSQHYAQNRRVVFPQTPQPTTIATIPSTPLSNHEQNLVTKVIPHFADSVIVDPDGQLSLPEIKVFKDINKSFNNVINPKFGAYNGRSGPIRAKVNFGPGLPPPQKGKLPLYNQRNMHLLQEKADELEALKVLLKPEDVGVTPLYVSPSFLVTKPSGGHRMVTAFNNLGLYARILPTASTTCSEVLRKISAFKFIIKSDLTKSFYQIPVEKSSM